MSAVRAPAERPADYRHVSKLIRPAPAIALEEAVLKWYDIAPATSPCRPSPGAGAREPARRRGRGSLESRDDLGFVILHRCGESFYFLIVCHLAQRQRGLGDGLGEGRRQPTRLPAVAARGDAPPDVLRLGARRGLARAAGVEPLPPLARGADARDAYLRDTFEGEV